MTTTAIVKASRVKLAAQDRAVSLNAIGVAVYAYSDARNVLLQACRDAEKQGIKRDDIMEFVALAYLGKALGRSGVTVQDVATLRAIAAKPSNTTKQPDDLKRSDKEQAAWDAARQGKSRALASLGWIAKGSTNVRETDAARQARVKAETAKAPVTTVAEQRFAVPKFEGAEDARKYAHNLSQLMATCQKQNAKVIPAPIATAMSEFVKAIKAALA